MGIPASKVCKQLPQNDLQEGSIPSTPIVAPKVIKHESVDPRSPSTHISRTPLQLLSSATLELDDLKGDAVAVTNVDETPAKTRMVLLGIDPRSPTAEFKRTPIIINVSEPDALEKIHNKNVEKIKRSVVGATPKSTCKKVSEKITSTVPPKLLESSPIKTRLDMNKRKSFVGLLETNIDFTETDLDAVIKEKSKIKERTCTLNAVITPKHKQFYMVQGANIDPRSPTSDFLRTPIQIIKKMPDLDINNEVEPENESECVGEESQSEIDVELEDHNIIEKCVEEICEKVHLTTELETRDKQLLLQTDIQTTVTPPKLPVINENKFRCEIQETHSQNVDPEILVEIKSAPITPKTNNGSLKLLPEVLKETKSAPVSPPRVNLTADVKEFDKKLTNLIYHDEDIIICPRKVKLKNYDTRSPLKCINSGEPSKKTHTLKLNDRLKSEYAVTKIPVFKEKNKTEVQCENTPPRNMEKRKVKVRKSHWDNADTTLII